MTDEPVSLETIARQLDELLKLRESREEQRAWVERMRAQNERLRSIRSPPQ